MASYDKSLQEAMIGAAALISKPGERSNNIDQAKMNSLMNISMRWMFDELAAQRNSSARFETTVVLAIDQTSIGLDEIQASTILTPTRLWERKQSSTENWIQMELRSPLPKNVATSQRLRWWDFRPADDRQAGFWFTGASQRNEVRIEYVGRIAAHIDAPRDVCWLIGSTDILSLYTAALHMQTAEKFQSADRLFAQARERLDQMLTRDTQLWQMRPVRAHRRRFGLTQRKGW